MMERLPEPEGICNADAPLVLNIAGFVGDSIVDGPGLRCVVFCQGCPHGCPGCHNPSSHPFGSGTTCTPGELLARIESYPLCRGVTFSGGEPFSQAGPLCILAAELKERGYELAAFSGYTFEELIAGTPQQKALLQQLDILVDGRYVEAQRTLSLRFRGSANQRILDLPASLAQGRAVPVAQPRWAGEEAERSNPPFF